MKERKMLNLLNYFLQFTLGHIVLAYIFLQHIVPRCQEAMIHIEQMNYFKIFVQVLGMGAPGTYLYLTVFYGLFHVWTNFWGEATRFADRRFYADWWNSGNLSEYWRKWNYPIHNWLVRHVYFPLVRRGVNPEMSRVLTFVVSALFHEYVVIGIFRAFTLAGFSIMIVNIPIIFIQSKLRNVVSKNQNNSLYWLFFTILGLPSTIMAYYYLNERHTLYEKGGPLYKVE